MDIRDHVQSDSWRVYLRTSLIVPLRSGAPCRALWGSPPACAHDTLTCCLTLSCTSGLRPSSNRANCRGTAVWREDRMRRDTELGIETQAKSGYHTYWHTHTHTPTHAPYPPLQPSAQWCWLWWGPKIAALSPWVAPELQCTGFQQSQPEMLYPGSLTSAGTPSGSSPPLEDKQSGCGSERTKKHADADMTLLRLWPFPTMTEDVVPSSGVLGPQGSTHAQQ